MANVLPTVIFPGYEEKAAAGAVTADSIVIPKSALIGLSEAEADAATGNGMEVFRQLMIKTYSVIQNLPENEKPTKITINKQPFRFLENGNFEETFVIRTEVQYDSTAATLASE